METRQPPRKRPSLDAAKLEELALNYVGRFATSRSKLTSYLQRKIRERGWDGPEEPPVDGLADRLVELGYVDDQAFALARARSLTARGYGLRRVRQALSAAGIDEANGAQARDLAQAEAVQAALRFARKRAIGPYALAQLDPRQRQRSLAAMLRAGHRFDIAKAIIDLKPGEIPDFGDINNAR